MSVLAYGLATFGITHMVRNTDGPFDIFLRFRKLAGIAYVPELDERGVQVHIIEEIPEKWLAKLVGCFWCLGTWVALVVTFKRKEEGFPLIWFSSIGLAGLLHEVIDG